MRVRTSLVPMLFLAASTPMAAQEEMPAALQRLKSHRYVRRSSPKAHQHVRMVPMMSKRRADAMVKAAFL